MRGIAITFVAACTIPPRVATLETADTLGAGEHAVEVGGGAGAWQSSDSIGGGTARVRVGVGGRQELGVDADVLWSGSTVVGGAALAYKRALAAGFAFVAGAGMTAGNDAQSTCAGGDLGAIASTAPGPGRVQLYGGVRLAAAMRVRGDRHAGGGISQGAFVPVGLVWPWRPGWRVIVEGGAVGTLSEAYSGYPGDTTVRTTHRVGGYGALALGVSF
jgi:hypothetical protein